VRQSVHAITGQTLYTVLVTRGGRGYMLPEEEVQGLAECLLELDQNLHEGQTPQHQVKVEDQASTIKEKLKQ